MPRKGKKATDTAKTSGKCTVAETEVAVSPQEERNDPPTPPTELVDLFLNPGRYAINKLPKQIGIHSEEVLVSFWVFSVELL